MFGCYRTSEMHKSEDAVIEGSPPIAADLGGFPDVRSLGFFGFSGFSKSVDFVTFPSGFGFWEDLQSIGNGCWLQMDGFSTHFEPSESIFNDFHVFGNFVVVSGGLMLFSEGSRTRRECPGGPRTLSECPAHSVATCRDMLGLVGTCSNLSHLVWSPVALMAVPRGPYT